MLHQRNISTLRKKMNQEPQKSPWSLEPASSGTKNDVEDNRVYEWGPKTVSLILLNTSPSKAKFIPCAFRIYAFDIRPTGDQRIAPPTAQGSV